MFGVGDVSGNGAVKGKGALPELVRDVRVVVARQAISPRDVDSSELGVPTAPQNPLP